MLNTEESFSNKLLNIFREKKYDEAENFAKLILKKYNNNQLSLKILSFISYNNNNYKEALNYNLKLLKINNSDSETYFNLGNIFFSLGETNKAVENYKEAINLKNNYYHAYNNLGLALKKNGKLNETVFYLRKAIELRSDYYEAINNLGNTLRELDRLDEAELLFRQAIELKPKFIHAYINLGILLRETSKFKLAEKCYKKVIKINPNIPEAYNNLGVIYKFIGRIKDAELNYRQAIRIKNDYSEAYRNLCDIKVFKKKDIDFFSIKNLIEKKYLSNTQKSDLNFALAKAYEDLRLYKEAFSCYKKGNTLRYKSNSFNINNEIKLFDKIKYIYNEIDQINIQTDNHNNITPIFIIGMPRSGTTLVEQIISSHSKIQAGGELNTINKNINYMINDLSKNNHKKLFNFRNKYFEYIKTINKKKLYITDKMPQNFRYIGIILTAIPEAKIIHVNRNTQSVLWSNFKHCFVKEGLNYSFQIKDITDYFKLYKSIIKFWNYKFKNKIYNVNYELLVNNQESEIKKLINYIGLNWENNCLFPEKNNRISLTASNLQVKKRIYKNSTQSWENFKPYINGAFDEL